MPILIVRVNIGVPTSERSQYKRASLKTAFETHKRLIIVSAEQIVNRHISLRTSRGTESNERQGFSHSKSLTFFIIEILFVTGIQSPGNKSKKTFSK